MEVRLEAGVIDSADASAADQTNTATNKQVTRIFWCASDTAGSVTITPYGKTGFTIPIPADSGWMGLSFLPRELPAGTTVQWSGVASHTVFYTAP